jgi:hypothetical protein
MYGLRALINEKKYSVENVIREIFKMEYIIEQNMKKINEIQKYIDNNIISISEEKINNLINRIENIEKTNIEVHDEIEKILKMKLIYKSDFMNVDNVVLVSDKFKFYKSHYTNFMMEKNLIFEKDISDSEKDKEYILLSKDYDITYKNYMFYETLGKLDISDININLYQETFIPTIDLLNIMV